MKKVSSFDGSGCRWPAACCRRNLSVGRKWVCRRLGDETLFFSRRLRFPRDGETDNGLSFGADIRPGEDRDRTGGQCRRRRPTLLTSVFISGAFGPDMATPTSLLDWGLDPSDVGSPGSINGAEQRAHGGFDRHGGYAVTSTVRSCATTTRSVIRRACRPIDETDRCPILGLGTSRYGLRASAAVVISGSVTRGDHTARATPIQRRLRGSVADGHGPPVAVNSLGGDRVKVA